MGTKKVLIGGAWPYANGSLHLGHIAALLPGDILARYFRLTGAEVLYVSGSDCHGTPISLRAEAEGVSPEEIANKYHKEFITNFEKLGFSYDVYTQTTAQYHKKHVQQFVSQLYNSGWLMHRTEKVCYCSTCHRFLPDRYVIGQCYSCGKPTRGDQCDNCNTVIEMEKLIDIKCNICNTQPEFKETEHLFFKLSNLQDKISELLDKNSKSWRQNAVSLTRRYLNEGLINRAITRDIDWGIEIPIEGFEQKRVYVWFEAVLGYITAVLKWHEEHGCAEDAYKFFGDDLKAYYVHGKDNIPFHTVILPGLLMALGIKALPTKIVSSEYLTIEGRKLSTSRNWAVWVPDYLENYDPDPLRFFLIMNGPENRDSDFSWREFVEKNNGELLGAYGNIVNRTLSMVIKNFGHAVPEPAQYQPDDTEILDKAKELFDTVGKCIEECDFKEGLKKIFDVVRDANKYIDTQAPWSLTDSVKQRLATILNVCVELILNISSLLYPYIPHIAAQALSFLNEQPAWNYRRIKPNKINQPVVLVKKLDKKVIETEVQKLGK